MGLRSVNIHEEGMFIQFLYLRQMAFPLSPDSYRQACPMLPRHHPGLVVPARGWHKAQTVVSGCAVASRGVRESAPGVRVTWSQVRWIAGESVMASWRIF